MGSSFILPPPGQPKEGPDVNFKQSALPNLVTFAFEDIRPPSEVYIQRDDVLVVQVVADQALTVTINARLLLVPFEEGGQPATSDGSGPTGMTLKQGVVQPIQKTIAVAAPYNGPVTLIPLSEGYLLAVAAICNATVQRGEVFVRAFLVRGSSAFTNGLAFQPLFSDYVTGQNPAGWPGGRILHPTEGPGNIKTVNVSNPAAGADWSYTPSIIVRSQVLSFTALLTTSAAVATRIVRAQFKDGSGNLVAQVPPGASQAASLAVVYTGIPNGIGSTVDPATIQLGLPEPPLIEANGSIGTNTTAIQAADQWSAIHVEVMEWLDLD
jgi:hypothetical protein